MVRVDWWVPFAFSKRQVASLLEIGRCDERVAVVSGVSPLERSLQLHFQKICRGSVVAAVNEP